MASRTIKGAGFSPDTVAFLQLLASHRVRYLIVGGEAVIFHGYPRVTGDVNFFYDNSALNAARLFRALEEFWACGTHPSCAGAVLFSSSGDRLIAST